jgi:ankyrin repeat protein
MLQSGATALHQAAKEGYKEICLYLIEVGADPNLADNVRINTLSFLNICTIDEINKKHTTTNQ